MAVSGTSRFMKLSRTSEDLKLRGADSFIFTDSIQHASRSTPHLGFARVRLVLILCSQ